MYLDAILFSNIFKTFTKSLVVRDCNGTSVGDVVVICRIESYNTNRMRNLHAFIKQEFGEESVLKLQLWEKAEKKMADYKNHRIFSIKCLKRDIIPVSIKLRTSLHTRKASQIVRKAENSY